MVIPADDFGIPLFSDLYRKNGLGQKARFLQKAGKNKGVQYQRQKSTNQR